MGVVRNREKRDTEFPQGLVQRAFSKQVTSKLELEKVFATQKG